MAYDEMKAVIRAEQEKREREHSIQFYTEHPEYLRGKTLEEFLEKNDASDLPEGGEPDWMELPDGVTSDGHTVRTVETFGGEGQGDSAWVVFEYDGVLYRKEGYYASYDGFFWDDYGSDLFEVEPVQVVKTEYRKVN